MLAHGASEHGGRYAWVGERLAERGFALYAGDHRGHGRSEGPRALVEGMDNIVADLDKVVDVAWGTAWAVPWRSRTRWPTKTACAA